MRAGVKLAFAFMNIQTAAGYMKHGYRIRRASWEQGGYLCDDYFVEHTSMVPDGMSQNKRPFQNTWMPEPEDLIADDWELILEGIVNDFGIVQYEESK